MTEPVLYHWPAGRRLWCKPCDALTVHDLDPGDNQYVLCAGCLNPVLGAQVVSLYSDDKYMRVPQVLLPLELRSRAEVDAIVARILNHAPHLGVVGSYMPEDDSDPYVGLDDILKELAG